MRYQLGCGPGEQTGAGGEKSGGLAVLADLEDGQVRAGTAGDLAQPPP
jgi:hypothetical protein